MSIIYHITTRNAALAAGKSGQYRTLSLAQDGFIHFSQQHQLLGVANAFYADQTDLVILVVDEKLLTAELKYEAPAHPTVEAQAGVLADDQLFPHLYGPLNFKAVINIVDFPLSANGQFDLPVFS